MRRTALTPLITALALGVVLLPATALGLFGTADRGASDRTPQATTTAPATAIADRLDIVARQPDGVEKSGDTPIVDTPSGVTPSRDTPIVDPVVPADHLVVDTRPVDRPVPHIRLGCSLILPDAARLTDVLTIRPDFAPAVACRWTAVEVDTLRGYQLWRAVDAPGGGPRELIATVPAGDPLRFLDTHVSRGHAYTYAVIAIARDGSKIAVSAPVVVKVPPPADTLRMACELTSVGDHRGVVCKWSEAHHPAAAGYVLWRSVDGGAREAIYRTGLDGRLGFFDAKIRPGQVIRYAVIVVDKLGHPVGEGGPLVVKIPALVDTRPIDPIVPPTGA